ncbi:hypothetical protein [Spiroplasma turonicum]|uniref:Uncharacterized protein n=1 Tax=Spiroplasma turonicum TaxID=216946 RepID=A0A0K1P5F3_9MOLU|nr:hypothetical protein [Spiroplasma turonicum]AKU79515.1 hypothetical protein STURON_00269 [Spiroplasma turonicum]ALX70538.1 hypothetical protein STURO_v1c02700 [Spiroplasma turonicum]
MNKIILFFNLLLSLLFITSVFIKIEVINEAVIYVDKHFDNQSEIIDDYFIVGKKFIDIATLTKVKVYNDKYEKEINIKGLTYFEKLIKINDKDALKNITDGDAVYLYSKTKTLLAYLLNN